jgi:hypothetical protein
MKPITHVASLVSLFVLAIGTGGAFVAAAPPVPPVPPLPVVHDGFGGIWVLNRDRGDAPGSPNAPNVGDDGSGRGGGNRGAGGGGGRRRGGGGGGGGRGSYGGGGRGREDGAGHEEQLGRREAIIDYMRAATEASRQLTIVVHEDAVSITDAEGRVQSLKTDNKKIEERAENGLVKLSRKARWEGDVLVYETDVESGPTVVRRYELSPGGTQLQVSTAINGFRGGNPTKLVRMYDRPVEPR